MAPERSLSGRPRRAAAGSALLLLLLAAAGVAEATGGARRPLVCPDKVSDGSQHPLGAAGAGRGQRSLV